jgi:hypothetical protein
MLLVGCGGANGLRCPWCVCGTMRGAHRLAGVVPGQVPVWRGEMRGGRGGGEVKRGRHGGEHERDGQGGKDGKVGGDEGRRGSEEGRQEWVRMARHIHTHTYTHTHTHTHSHTHTHTPPATNVHCRPCFGNGVHLCPYSPHALSAPCSRLFRHFTHAPLVQWAALLTHPHLLLSLPHLTRLASTASLALPLLCSTYTHGCRGSRW